MVKAVIEDDEVDACSGRSRNRSLLSADFSSLLYRFAMTALLFATIKYLEQRRGCKHPAEPTDLAEVG